MAIYNYTKSLNIDDSNHVNYSNRSAAYLKAGDYERALEDANSCIELRPDYAKGYGRKGSAYHAMKKYKNAVSAYKEGLKVCNDDPYLQKGLAAAKNAKLESTKAGKAVKKSEATQKASNKRRSKAKKATNVSSFVEQTRRELKLQLAAIQAQLDLINELAQMSDDEKLDLLFSLIDRDGDGTVDATELAAALRKRNEDLSFTDSLERAIDMVAIFDTDGDAKLDYDEFSNFISVMLKELGIDFHEFSEFLVLQILFKDEKNEEEKEDEKSVHSKVKEREELFDMLTDARMVELFEVFDRTGSRTLPFGEVAERLYTVTLDMDASVQKTMGLLLMMEEKELRTLNYEQFGRLIMAIVAAAQESFENVFEDLMISLTRQDTIDPRTRRNLMVSKESYRIVQELQKDDKNIQALSYERLQKLFDLWDADGSGDITLQELQTGLKKFQDASGIKADAKKEAEALLGFDEDGDNELGRVEFAKAMTHYAQAYKVDLQDLIDFMCVATSLGDNTALFQEAYGKVLSGIKDVPVLKPSNLTFADDDFSDFSDDDFGN